MAWFSRARNEDPVLAELGETGVFVSQRGDDAVDHFLARRAKGFFYPPQKMRLIPGGYEKPIIVPYRLGSHYVSSLEILSRKGLRPFTYREALKKIDGTPELKNYLKGDHVSGSGIWVIGPLKKPLDPPWTTYMLDRDRDALRKIDHPSDLDPEQTVEFQANPGELLRLYVMSDYELHWEGRAWYRYKLDNGWHHASPVVNSSTLMVLVGVQRRNSLRK